MEKNLPVVRVELLVCIFRRVRWKFIFDSVTKVNKKLTPPQEKCKHFLLFCELSKLDVVNALGHWLHLCTLDWGTLSLGTPNPASITLGRVLQSADCKDGCATAPTHRCLTALP